MGRLLRAFFGLLLLALVACATNPSGSSGPGGQPSDPDGPPDPSDITPPAVVGMFPPIGAINVTARDPITLTFTEAVKPSSVSEQNLVLRVEGNPIPSTVALSADRKTATIAPKDYNDLGSAENTTLSVQIRAGITDLSGNPLVPPQELWYWLVHHWWNISLLDAKGTLPCTDNSIFADKNQDIYRSYRGWAKYSEENPLMTDCRYSSWNTPTFTYGLRRFTPAAWEVVETPFDPSTPQTHFADREGNLWAHAMVDGSTWAYYKRVGQQWELVARLVARLGGISSYYRKPIRIWVDNQGMPYVASGGQPGAR